MTVLFLLIPCLALGQAGSPRPGGPPGVPVDKMTDAATVVGVGTVVNQSVRENPTNHGIYTDYQVQFTDVWKGNPSDPFIVSKVGGTLNGYATAIVGQEYSLKNGESLVFFVHPSGLEPTHVVIGLQQGLYRVAADGSGMLTRLSEAGVPSPLRARLTLQELKEQVHHALGKALPPAAGARPGGGDSGGPPTGRDGTVPEAPGADRNPGERDQNPLNGRPPLPLQREDAPQTAWLSVAGGVALMGLVIAILVVARRR